MSLPGFSVHFFRSVKANASPESTFTVNSAGDAADINPGDGFCNDGSGSCTLRAAIQEANAVSGADTINFSLPPNSTITLSTQLPNFVGNFSIVGPGSSLLTIQRSSAAGTPIFQIFSFVPINGNFNDSVSGLTLLNGNATGPFTSNMSGGGIFNYSACVLTLTDVVISGSTSTNGGGLYNEGTATLTNCKVTGNNSPNGGGILNRGTMTIINSTVSANAANNGTGGGIQNSGGTLSITNSTVSGNTCDGQGAGIVNTGGFNGAGSVTLTNSTVSGNSAINGGIGAIANLAGGHTLTLSNTSITANSASGSGSGVGGIFNGSGSTANLKNSIVAKNTSALMPHDLNGTFNSQGYNLIGESTGTDGFMNGINGDQVGTPGSPVDPKLGVLADNGGPTSTHLLLPASPAIDAGNSVLTTYQRGQPRPIDDPTVVNAGGGNASDIGAYEAHYLEVNTTADADDGLCRPLGTGNGCTLREAINAVNAGPGAESIVFAPALTSGGPATINLLSPLPNIADDVTLTGPGASQLTVRRNSGGFLRVFNVTATGIVSFSGLTIADGVADLSGGGIQNFSTGTVNVTACTLSGNSVPNGFGGGIFNKSTGTVNVTGSTLSGNSAPNASGGAISNSSTGTVSVINSTITANQAGTAGGGIDTDSGTVNVVNSTLSGNSANLGSGGGIVSGTGTVNLTNCTLTGNSAGNGGGFAKNINGTVNARNNIISGNSAFSNGPDIIGNFTSWGNNLIGKSDGGSGFTNGVNNDKVGTVALPIDARLDSLRNNGGPTQTHALLPGSPAIDAADNCVFSNSCSPTLAFALTTDQRGPGFNRAADGNGDGGSVVDVGAYEVQSFLVTNTNDAGAGSLRQAITDANANSGTQSISFQSGLTGIITLSTALPDLSTDLLIVGPGANLLTIQRSSAGGTPDFRIFTITPGHTVTISGVTLTNGKATAGGAVFNSGTLVLSNDIVTGNNGGSCCSNGGGGVYNNGQLTLTNSIVSSNSASIGGGLTNDSSGTLVLTNVTVSGNSAGGGGGGILNNFGNLTMTNSSVSGNSTSGGGGGGLSSYGPLTVTNSTISGNTTANGDGAGIASNSLLTLTNSTVSGNIAQGSGGGILNLQSATLNTINSTLTGNTANGGVGPVPPAGGGIYNSGVVNLKNTIIDNNTVAAAGSGPDLFGTFNSRDYNLIGNTGAATINGTTTHNIINQSARLGPLANNGGPTQTHALLAGSPALDAGDNCVVNNSCLPAYGFLLSTDQRGTGFSRNVDGPDADTTATVDIGAFEAQLSLADIVDQTINEDGTLSLPFNLGGAASITGVTATSSNTSLVPNNPANISISGSGSTRTLQITPVANLFGSSTITLTVSGNNGQTMTDTFVLTVNSVNDAPSFTKGANQTINENSLAQTVDNWATNLSPGPANEAGQTLTFVIAGNSNPSLFAAAPAISSTGKLTYTPATGVSGVATIVVALMDNGGTANGGIDTSATQSFNITVRDGGTLAFNGAPYNVAEDGGSASITVTRTDGSAGIATVQFATSNGTATAADYTSVSQVITFNDGEVNKTVSIPITDDLLHESGETVNLTLSNVGGTGQLGAQATAVLTILDNDPTGGYLRFSSANFNTTESSGSTSITVQRFGDTTQAASVNYATADDITVVPCGTINGIASSRCDFTSALGTLRFEAGETSKTFAVLITQDNYVEGPESLTITVSGPAGGAALATPSTATLTIADDAGEPAGNPIDIADVFVRQQYHDFLNREPDADGLAYWSNQITQCEQPGAICDPGAQRVNVSAAFFLSIEFQETGFLVERIYKTAYGDADALSALDTYPNQHPIKAPIVKFKEFLGDTQQISKDVIVGVGNWPGQLEANKVAFTQDFVARARFVAAFPTTMTPAEFVDKLFANAGVTPTATERSSIINEFGGAGTSANTTARARALRRVAENPTLAQAETNKAFVLMQYFGYLRRDPNAAPDTDHTGYDFWLHKLDQFNGNYINAEMVRAFISSIEYRQRFAP